MCARYSDEWKAGLLDPERRFHGLGIYELLEELGLEAGMTVVEYGCGPGLVALQAAVMVGPSGKVYGIDIHQGMVSLVNSRAAEAGLTNVTALLKDGPSAPLPGGAANLVTCFLVFHYMESRAARQELAADLSRLAKPGGRVAVIQWDHYVPYTEKRSICLRRQALSARARTPFPIASTGSSEPSRRSDGDTRLAMVRMVVALLHPHLNLPPSRGKRFCCKPAT